MTKDLEQRNIEGTRYSFIGKTLSAVILFVLSVVVTRYLGPDAYGELSLAITIILFTSVFIDFGFNRSTQKHISQYMRDDLESVKDAYRKMLNLKVISVIVSVAFIFLVSGFLGSIFDSSTLSDLLKAGSLLLAGTILLEFNLSVLQGYESFKQLQRVNIAEAGLKFLATLIVIYLGMNVLGILAGFSLTTFLLSVFVTIVLYLFIMNDKTVNPLPDNYNKNKSRDLRKEIISYAPPIYLSVIFFLIYTKFDILVLGYFQGTTEVGYYSLATGLIDNLLIPLVAIETTIMPLAASLFGKVHDRNHMNVLFNQTFVNSFFFMMPIIAGLIVVASTFVKEVYGQDFLKTAFVLIALTPFIFTKTIAVLNGAFLIGANKATVFMKYTFGAVILNILLLVVLIPSIGIYGAVLAKVVSHSVLTFSMLIYIIKYFKVEIDSSSLLKCVKIVISSIVMAILSYFVLYVSGGKAYGLVLTMISGAIFYIILLHITKTVTFKQLLEMSRGNLPADEL
ncbi:MAG: flippase [Methanolobus sp.]